MTYTANLPQSTQKKITLCIDWISTTAKARHMRTIYTCYPALHDWENWHDCNGKLGYTTAVKHTIGVLSMINYDRPDMGIHTQYSGTSLRRLEEMNGSTGIDVLRHHIKSGHTIARLDIALDFINCGINVMDFENAYMMGACITTLKTASSVKSLTHAGHTFYIGSQKTRKKLIRIYDKGAEQGLDNADWLRVELQLMGKPATKAGVSMPTENIEKYLISILKTVVDFPTISEWARVTSGLQAVKLGSESAEKGDTRRWLMNQCVPALAKEVRLDMEFWMQFSAEVFIQMEKNDK